jgi:single-strand DNA-binding protein
MRYTDSGTAVARFTLAVDRNYTNQQGEREADFIFISVWRGLAENCAKYLSKGSLIALEGRIQVRSYENKEGRTVWSTEVVADNVRFLDSRNSQKGENNFSGNNAGFNNQNQQNRPSNQDPFQSVGKPIDLSDDDLPF